MEDGKYEKGSVTKEDEQTKQKQLKKQPKTVFFIDEDEGTDMGVLRIITLRFTQNFSI